MAFKTFTNGSVLTQSDLNDYLMKQAVIVCTSSTRPASPVEGMLVFETDTDLFQLWTGSAWAFVAVGGNPMRGRGYFTNTPTSTSGGEQAIFRIDNIPMKANRVHRISVTGFGIDATGVNNDYALRWRMTDNGTIPSTSSTEIGSARGRVFLSGAGAGATFPWITTYVSPGSDITWGGLITMEKSAGSNTITFSPRNGGVHVVIMDVGPATAATGITF